MIEFETPNGKKITIVNVGRLLKIQFTSGGELPEELSGLFTDVRTATIAINKYLETKAPRSKKSV